MSVRVDVAVDDGLVAGHDGHTYYFCPRGMPRLCEAAEAAEGPPT